MAEEVRLESGYRPKAYRGFESRSLRNVAAYLSGRFFITLFVNPPCQTDSMIES